MTRNPGEKKDKRWRYTRLEVWRFLWKWQQRNAIPPSFLEIAAALNLTKTPVYSHLLHLERDGVIERKGGQHRAIHVLIAPPEDNL
jgi:DNA-binding MarR family transcriptional regulator